MTERMEILIKTNTAGLWVMILVIVGLMFIPLGLSMEAAKSLGMPLLFGLAFSIQMLVRQNKLKTEPHLILDAQKIRCLPVFGKAWEVPLEQIESIDINEKVLTVQRGKGGKKYVVPVKSLPNEDRMMIRNWADNWQRAGGVR